MSEICSIFLLKWDVKSRTLRQKHIFEETSFLSDWHLHVVQVLGWLRSLPSWWICQGRGTGRPWARPAPGEKDRPWEAGAVSDPRWACCSSVFCVHSTTSWVVFRKNGPQVCERVGPHCRGELGPRLHPLPLYWHTAFPPSAKCENCWEITSIICLPPAICHAKQFPTWQIVYVMWSWQFDGSCCPRGWWTVIFFCSIVI